MNVAVDDDVPCAVCDVAHVLSVIWIPAKMICPAGWYIEYARVLQQQQGFETVVLRLRSIYVSMKMPNISEKELDNKTIMEGCFIPSKQPVVAFHVRRTKSHN